MDVANSHHLAKTDYEDDVTAKGVAEMRRRSAAQIGSEEWDVIDSAEDRVKHMGFGHAADRS